MFFNKHEFFYLMRVWFYDMKLSLLVNVVFIVIIAIYIVGD